MASGGWRRNTPRVLPPNWRSIRARVLIRDRYVCQIGGPACAVDASEVDHVGDPNVHDDGNLRAVCVPCHRERTKQQSTDALKTYHARKYRTPESHPGLK